MKKILLIFFVCYSSCYGQLATVKYIILETGVDGLNKQNSAQVAFYVNLPDSNNFAGKNFRTIATIVRDTTSQLSFLTGALLDSIKIGAKLEIIRTVKFDAGLTKGQKRTAIDNVFINNLSAFLEKWFAEHDFYGLERTLP